MKKNLTKRLMGLLLAVLMAASLSMPALAKRSFTDVRGGQWYYAPIEYAYARGMMNGTGNGAFDPGGKVWRAMVPQTLYNKANKPAHGPSPFRDVLAGDWYLDAIAWCREEGIISDDLVLEGNTFDPIGFVTRQDVCVMVYNYMIAAGKTPDQASDEEMARFSDLSKVSEYAQPAIRWAVKSGFMKGKQAGSDYQVDPLGSATRSELAQFLLNLDGILGLDTTFTPPADDGPEFVAPTRISGLHGGLGVNGISFKPEMGYKAQYVLANNKLFSGESWSSIVNRTGAYIAFNGAFFESSGDYETNAMMINNGEVWRIDNDGAPAKSTFVIDKNGRASIQHMQIIQTYRQFRDGVDITPDYGEAGVQSLLNSKLPANADWYMTQTRLFGATVPGHVLYAAGVDANGKVVAKHQNASNVPVPEGGYVVFQRHQMSQWDTFLQNVQVGDTLQRHFDYKGSTTQDIQMAFSCGPTVVKNGAAYGNNATYAEEQFGTVPKGSAARMCLGVKADGTVVVIRTNGTLQQLSNAMAALGCQDAFNIDGGASTLLYWNGSALTTPSRTLSNVIVFTQA